MPALLTRDVKSAEPFDHGLDAGVDRCAIADVKAHGHPGGLGPAVGPERSVRGPPAYEPRPMARRRGGGQDLAGPVGSRAMAAESNEQDGLEEPATGGPGDTPVPGGLEHPEAELDALLASVPAGVVYTDKAGTILDANSKAAEILGNELRGKPLAEFVVDSERLALTELLGRLDSIPRSEDVSLVPVEGEPFTTLMTAALVDSRPGRVRWLVHDLREQRRAEADLAESEARYRTVVERLPAITYVAMLGGSGRTLYISPQVEDILGIRPEDWLAEEHAFTRHLHPEDRDRVLAAVAASQRGEEPLDITYRMIDARGQVRWIRDLSGPVKGALGSTGVFQGLMLDQSAHAELDLQMRRLASIVDTTDDAIIAYDLNGTLSNWNGAAEEMYGYRADEILGRGVSTIVPDDRRREFSQILWQIERGERVDHFETTRLHRDGHLVDVSLTISPIRSEDGQVIGASAIARDISRRRRTDAALRRSEERYRTLMGAMLDTAVDGIITIDEEGKVEAINRAAQRIFGYTVEEVLGNNVSMLMPDPYRGEHDGYLSAYMDTGIPRIIGTGREVEGRRKDGSTFPVDLAVSEVRLEGRRLFTGFVRDITSRRRLEEEFRQAQKMEAVGRLASGIAHDFNNLLMGIMGCCRMAEGALVAGHPALEHIQDILAAADRGSALTRQLLAFSRRRATEPRPIDLNEVVLGAQKILAQLLGEDIILHLDLRQGGVPVLADAGQMEQTLMNLVVNARDAMRGGGRLTILTEVCASPVDEGKLELADPTLTAQAPPHAATRPWAHLSVQDTGTGMDEETRTRIFEPFFTTKATGEGTGLGLSTAYAIVQQSGGLIQVESELGAGTTFHIWLPLDESAQVEEELPEKPPAPKAAGETILLVEDERLVRASVRHFLQDLGYTVVDAGEPAEALDLMAANEDPIDLLLTDIVMPGMNGPELAEEVRRRSPETKILFMSAFPRESLLGEGRIQPEDASMEKPFSDDELASRVRELLD